MRQRQKNGFVLALATLAIVLATAGCNNRIVHAAAPVAAAPAPETVRPMTTAPDTDATPPVEAAAAAPTVTADASAPPTLPHSTLQPPRRPATEQPANEVNSEAAKPVPPQITIQLSPGDQANLQRTTSDDLSVSERTLQQAQRRTLNAAQQDLVGKIRSFADQSRDASKAGDWARAQNLAQKARLLSVELLNSL